MLWKRLNVYQVALHALLIVMAVLLVGLTRENRELGTRLAPPPLLEVGHPVEPIPVRDVEGAEQTLRFSKHEQESLLFIFTTTCGACQASQPIWRTLHRDLQDRVRIIGVSLDDEAATRTYIAEHDLSFQVVLPMDRARFSEDYAVSRVPLTVHVGPEGKVQSTWLGPLPDEALEDLRSESQTGLAHFF